MMQQVNVKFNDVEQIREFVSIIDKIDANFDLGSGQKIVDAKSILGVMSMDLNHVLTVKCYGESPRFESFLQRYAVA